MKTNKKRFLREALIISSLILSGCNNEVKTENETTNITTSTLNFESIDNTEINTIIENNVNEIINDLEEEKPNEHVDLLMIGDSLIHSPVYKSGIQEDGTLNYDHFFTNIQSDIDEAEIAIINQETILGGTELGISSYPCFNSPQEIGDAEAKAGFNVILHATNHSMDKGFTAVEWGGTTY